MAGVNVSTPAPVDPWSAGIMGATSVATAALKDGQSQAHSNQNNSADFSAWTLSIGSTGATSAAVERANVPGNSLSGLLGNPIVLAGLAVAAVLYLHR